MNDSQDSLLEVLLLAVDPPEPPVLHPVPDGVDAQGGVGDVGGGGAGLGQSTVTNLRGDLI